MTQGNFILMKGRSNAGKHLVIKGAIESFLKKERARVIHIALKAPTHLPRDDRISYFTAQANESSAFVTPYMGLQAAL